MVVRVATVAFEGLEARPLDVQVQLSGGATGFVLVGLADKAVGESRERLRPGSAGQMMARPQPAVRAKGPPLPDLKDIKGQESARRALEIAAASVMSNYSRSRRSIWMNVARLNAGDRPA